MTFDLPLTAREIQVLNGLARDETCAETARRLYLSPDTIRSHRRHVRGKLDTRTTAGALAAAIRLGIPVLDETP